MQKNATCAQALSSAAKGQWCKDLGNIPDTLAANLSFLEPRGMWSSELLTEIQHIFEVSPLWRNSMQLVHACNSCNVSFVNIQAWDAILCA